MLNYLITFDAVEHKRCTASVDAESLEEAERIVMTGSGPYKIISEESISDKQDKKLISGQEMLSYKELVAALKRGEIVYNNTHKEYYWMETLNVPLLGETKVILCNGYPSSEDLTPGVHRACLSELEGSANILTIYKPENKE